MLTANKTETAHAYDLTDMCTSPNADERTLVFIHGWLLSRAYWQPVIEQLSPDYRCLSYDLRGFGESVSLAQDQEICPQLPQQGTRQITLPLAPKNAVDSSQRNPENIPASASGSPTAYTASQYSLAAYAQELEALLDDLGLENVWLVGHSLGGSIALWAAYLMTDRVEGVVCINAGGGIYIPKEFEKFRAAGQQMVKYRPGWLPGVPLLPRLFSRIMVNQPLSVCWGKQRLKDFVNADRTAAVGALLETTTRAEVHLLPQIVAHLTQPVHFITATEDSIMPPRYVRYLASFHPQFQAEETVSEIANCGHMAMVEQTEAVAQIVRRVTCKARRHP